MKITDEIREALRKAADQAGGQSELARKIGCNHAILSKYQSESTKRMHPTTWKQLLPFISPYLPQAAKDAPDAYDAKLDAVGTIVKTLEPFDGMTSKAILRAAIQLSGIESI